MPPSSSSKRTAALLGEIRRQAEDQPVAAQFAHRALYGVLFAGPALPLDSQGKLKDRQLGRVQD
jgi:hypothetical protein